MIKLVRRLFTVPDLKTGDNIQRFYKKANTAKSDSGFEILLRKTHKNARKARLHRPIRTVSLKYSFRMGKPRKVYYSSQNAFSIIKLDELNSFSNRLASDSAKAHSNNKADKLLKK